MDRDNYKKNQKIYTFSESTEELILEKLLSDDLDFHDSNSTYGSHNIHAFPAKFPPQLPRKFIKYMTEENDLILDPMMGSGTTIIEAISLNRKAIGLDIDPLAILMSEVKILGSDKDSLENIGREIIQIARIKIIDEKAELEQQLDNLFNISTKKFINYWFAKETQIELLALITEINKIKEKNLRKIFELIFSAIIITKSGGVSLAFDLAHTRPHRAKIVYDSNGNIIIGKEKSKNPSKREKFLTKSLESPIEKFAEKFNKIFKTKFPNNVEKSFLCSYGDSQSIPLPTKSIDLIVTSPPYAANAIDYMRAHKFSLVWLKHDINKLSNLRSEYIGAEAISSIDFEELPDFPRQIISKIKKKDEKKSLVLTRYYSEMTRVLREMFRVLKPGKSAIIVIGSSKMRGIDTFTEKCFAAIGEDIGFMIPEIGIRNLDRNRRMMPVGNRIDNNSQIQQRMHEEYVMGFYKPKGG
jgi:DNA modification methylase